MSCRAGHNAILAREPVGPTVADENGLLDALQANILSRRAELNAA